MNEKLFIIFGTGPDAVGLVERITTPVAAVQGNIIDLRQDVLHGLFTLFMVVDLAASGLEEGELSDLVRRLSLETGLDLRVDEYRPLPRHGARQPLLLILLGRDRPGIVAAVTGLLKTYDINVDLAEMIAREGVFLMELMVDLHRCAIPLDNLKGALRRRMGELGIDTLFQSEDVFNKKKRVLLFDIRASLMTPATREEILRLAGLPAASLETGLGRSEADCLCRAAGCLEGLPLEVMTQVARAVEVGPGTLELIQTLKTMGYKIALACRAFGCVAEVLRAKLGIDHCFGVPLAENDDAMTLTGELEEGALEGLSVPALIQRLARLEGVDPTEITVIANDPGDPTAPLPGINLRFDMKRILDYHNERILSHQALLGLLGSFGPPPIFGAEGVREAQQGQRAQASRQRQAQQVQTLQPRQIPAFQEAGSGAPDEHPPTAGSGDASR